MYAFLLILGAVITAAGLALLASGVSIQAHAFDVTNVTPGAIAVIGGCILIGLAFVVRALLRVERALVARPMPGPARLGETATAVASVTQSSEPAPIPFPPRPKTALQPASAAVVAAVRPVPAPAAEPEGSRAPERIESAPIVEESDVSLLPKAPARSDEENSEPADAVVGRTNGATHANEASQVATSGRPERRQPQAKTSIFDSLWPKAQRSPEIQTATIAQAAPPTPAPPPQPAAVVAAAPNPPPAPPASALPQPQPAAAVSILKSGVVEGMAYTLYSDGSIEAQLPGGTLRFGSITELRNHIEHNG